MTHRTQRIEQRPLPPTAPEWIEFDVVTVNQFVGTESRVNLRTRPGSERWPFLDVAITEYTGASRRAKLCSVRLEAEAMRKLYVALATHFDAGRTAA